MSKSTVSVTTCENYEKEQVRKAVSDAVNALGGIGSFVHPGEKVLIKPNFLYPSEAEKAITTHPQVISAVIEMVENSGVSDIMCGDSPGHGSCKDAFEKLGLDQKYMTPMDKEVLRNGMYFTSEALEADAIIGVCKMKTHMLVRVTGAVKNMYGLICGHRKAAGHVSNPSASSFAKMMTEIHNATHQRLHIMDAVIAMEGNGPSSGTPVHMGLILASADPVALDAVFCRLVHLDPTMVPTETYGYKEKLGTYKTDEIQVLLNGEAIEMDELVDRFGKPDFDVQREGEKLNALSILSKISGAFGHKPVLDKEKCVRCGICVSHCPVDGQAISFANGKDKPPVYDYKKCIRCYCCQEMCPQHAIRKK